jgi:hypothetical protein
VTGEPKPELIWVHKGQPITSGGRYTITEDVDQQTYVLQVTKVTPDDVGTFEVTASNPFGKVSCSAPLEVEGSTYDDH